MINQNEVIQNKVNKKMEEGFKRHGEQREVYIRKKTKKRERKNNENKNIFLTCECIHMGQAKRGVIFYRKNNSRNLIYFKSGGKTLKKIKNLLISKASLGH